MNNRFKFDNIGRVIEQRSDTVFANKILKNTYILLAFTILFSSFTACCSMLLNVKVFNPILTIVVYFLLLFSINVNRNNIFGILFTFVLTGFLGWTLGPVLNHYMMFFSNGAELVMLSLGITGTIFLVLSVLASNPSRNYSSIGSFLSVGSLVCLAAIILNIFLQLPALHLAISVIVAFVSGGLILWQINSIVLGGEENYVLVTVNIYISILNIFLTTLQFLSMFFGNRRD